MLRRHIWVAAIALLTAPVAFAQAPVMTVDTYLDGLGRQMSITPQQKKAWDHYAATLTNAGAQMKHEHHAKMAAMRSASWPERRKLVDQMVGGHRNIASSVHKAATDLWQTMDAEQRQKAKNILPGLAVPPGPGLG